VQNFQAFVQGVGFRTEVMLQGASRRQIVIRVVQNCLPQNSRFFEFVVGDEVADEVGSMLNESLIPVGWIIPHDVRPVPSVGLLETDDVGAIYVAELGIELRAERTPMEDAVADRADDTACQPSTDDGNQQCEHTTNYTDPTKLPWPGAPLLAF
jgi:hypothetical protein